MILLQRNISFCFNDSKHEVLINTLIVEHNWMAKLAYFITRPRLMAIKTVSTLRENEVHIRCTENLKQCNGP